MKILLTNPPLLNLITGNVPEILEQESDVSPPLGLMYLAAYLQKYSNYQVKILDCALENLNYAQLKNKISQEKPDVVGITALTFTFIDVIKTVKIVKSINPNIKVVLGGPHVHIYPKETMNIQEVDFCVLGEGEKVFKDLLDNINNFQALLNIQGIVFRHKNKIVNTGSQPFIQNLDDLPFPARELTDYKKYTSIIAKRFPITTMFTSRGCPYKCLFCDRPHLGKIFRALSANRVVAEMEEIKNMGIEEIFIYDDTFGIDRQRVLDICKKIKERNLNILWDIRTRVNTVDQEVLEALKTAGCQRIHYGVEAGTQKILDTLRKGITLDMVYKAFKATHEIGIETVAYFMLGSPNETREDINQTIKLAKQLKPDYAHFSITTPFPATDLYYLGLKQGILTHDYWKEFAKNPRQDFMPPAWEENLSQPELISLLKNAYRSFYFRPSYVWQRLKQISSFKELLTKAMMGLKMLKV